MVRATGVEQWFYPYDGSSPPWIKHISNPLGVFVRRYRADDVIAVRLGSGDGAIEQPVVDGHWYQANFHVRQWGPSAPWATLSAIRLVDLSWVTPVAHDIAMTEEAYVRERIADMRRGEMSEHLFHTVLSGDPAVAWRLLRRIIEAAPEDLLGDLGAGDLETFFRNHGDAYRDQIEQAARRDRNMAAALKARMGLRSSVERRSTGWSRTLATLAR